MTDLASSLPTGHPGLSVDVCGPPHLPETLDRVVILIDKPKGWSSFDVIRKLRPVLNVRKIGHAGTLDPMATGLLICLVGRATKLMESFMGLPKVYEGTLRLGEVTPSYDAETEIVERPSWENVSAENMEAARRAFTGVIEQTPPMYSAVKVKGERLYMKARRGEDVPRPPRSVVINRFEWIGHNGQDWSFRVHCSKGTYIRSLANDVGRFVGSGAHLVALRRTAIGPYKVENAWTLEALERAVGGASGTESPSLT